MKDKLTPEGVKFLAQWQQDYPETPPINYHFKLNLPKRWARIHSLPAGQRYPNSKEDWDILFMRQNAVIDHLVPQGTAIQFVWNSLERDSHIFKSFDLTHLGMFNDILAETECDCWLLPEIWESTLFNTFLMMIAGEMMRAFIIAPTCLISPYDGGMDIIFSDPYTAHAFKRTFADWVSQREDGL